MVEAALVAPALVLLLVGTAFMRELYLARASARLTARECAWQYAMSGCRGSRPAACTPGITPTPSEGLPNVARTALQTGDGVDPFSDVPVLGEAFRTLFGTSTRATTTAHVPFALDTERVGVASGEAVVLCNSVRVDALDIGKRWLCDRIGC